MESSKRAALAAIVAVAGLVTPTSVSAFTEPRTYSASPDEGGGGGRWFTGSPAEGYSCAVCHTGPGPEPLEIEGLPMDGYVPGQSYDVRIGWPDFAARADELRDEGKEPRMSLVAELVTETGEGSGVLEVVAGADAEEGELCVVPEGKQAAQLFAVRPGEDTQEAITGRCEATSLGQRCLVAVLACGASELRFRWTAPEQWQDGIYFAAGFVGADEVSDGPDDDRVTEVLELLPPAASTQAHHETTLGADCGVALVGRRSTFPMPAWLLPAVAVVACRRRRVR